jgi:nitroreductase
MDYDDFYGLIKTRRSIRRFKPDPIPDDIVDKILEVARWAPSCRNSQPWEIVAVKKQTIGDEIVRIMSDDYAANGKEPPAGPAQAQLFIIVCSNPENKPPTELGHLADSMFYSSLGNAFLYMAMAVTTLGLGAQWVSRIGNLAVEGDIKELLGIPASWEIFDMLAVGYPDAEPKTKLTRSFDEVVHNNLY